MSNDTLEELIKQGMQSSGKEINFLWQGGEPTLMGLDFFKKVIELQKKFGRGKIVGNGLQTNGTLINSEWCSFLKEHNFLVGLSLDGPEIVHDYHRRNINNKGSWKRVMQSYYQLVQHGVAVNILATISDHSVKHLKETHQFFKQLNADFIQYIPILETDKDGIKDLSLKAQDYGYFLTELWKLWLSDFQKGTAPNIRTFEAIFGNLPLRLLVRIGIAVSH